MNKKIRNPKVVLDNLLELENNQVITKVPCTIQIPTRFNEINLAEISAETYILGCFAIILESGEYAVLNINAIMEITPFKTIVTKINDIPYYEFSFNTGDTVIKNTNLVRRDSIIYDLFSDFIFRGKIPWYMNYDDVGKLFDTAKDNAGSNISESLETIELLISIISRSGNDKSKYIRQTIEDYKEINNNLEYVPLMSVFYSVNSTLNKLAGNYFNDGVVSSLITQTTKTDLIENIIRA